MKNEEYKKLIEDDRLWELYQNQRNPLIQILDNCVGRFDKWLYDRDFGKYEQWRERQPACPHCHFKPADDFHAFWCRIKNRGIK